MCSRNFGEMFTSTPHPTRFLLLHIIPYLVFVSLPFSNPTSQPEGPVAVGRYLCSLTPSEAYTFTMVFWWSSWTSTIRNSKQNHDWLKIFRSLHSSHHLPISWPPFIHSTRSVLHQVAVEFFRFKGGFKRYQHLGTSNGITKQTHESDFEKRVSMSNAFKKKGNDI